jgi:hypothetical protein
MWDKIALTKQLVESMGGITRRTLSTLFWKFKLYSCF